jgi:hypothetical protein
MQIRTPSGSAIHISSSLERAFDGVYGVFSVQNHHISGFEGEVRQGKQVAEVASEWALPSSSTAALAQASRAAAFGSWQTKLEVAAHIRTLPVTILHPTAFMERMTEGKFFPPASVWHLMPKLMGPDRPVGWLTVEDLAVIVATAFDDPDHFIGHEVMLASDVQSIDACRAIWREVTGRPPRRFPMPRGCSSGSRAPTRRPCGDGSTRTRSTLTRDRRWRSIPRR